MTITNCNQCGGGVENLSGVPCPHCGKDPFAMYITGTVTHMQINEITDQDLAFIYSSLSSCSPLVRGLAERLRRVEGESREMWKEIRAKEAQFRFCFNHGGSPGPAPEYCPKCLAVERERMKRMEEVLKSIADYSTYDAQDLRDMAGAALKEGGE